MIATVLISGVVPFAVRGIFTSLAEGTLLAALVWLVVRLVPQRNSGTRFAIWFSTLLAIALLTFPHDVHDDRRPLVADEIEQPASGVILAVDRGWVGHGNPRVSWRPCGAYLFISPLESTIPLAR